MASERFNIDNLRSKLKKEVLKSDIYKAYNLKEEYTLKKSKSLDIKELSYIDDAAELENKLLNSDIYKKSNSNTTASITGRKLRLETQSSGGQKIFTYTDTSTNEKYTSVIGLQELSQQVLRFRGNIESLINIGDIKVNSYKQCYLFSNKKIRDKHFIIIYESYKGNGSRVATAYADAYDIQELILIDRSGRTWLAIQCLNKEGRVIVYPLFILESVASLLNDKRLIAKNNIFTYSSSIVVDLIESLTIDYASSIDDYKLCNMKDKSGYSSIIQSKYIITQEYIRENEKYRMIMNILANDNLSQTALGYEYYYKEAYLDLMSLVKIIAHN